MNLDFGDHWLTQSVYCHKVWLFLMFFRETIREKIESTEWEVIAKNNHRARLRLLPAPTSG